VSTIAGVVEENFVITGRYCIEADFALLAGLGLGIKSGDADGIDIGILMGPKKYLRVADVAPFAGGRSGYSSMLDGKLKRLLGFGAEYFLGRQCSVEGSIGIGNTSVEVYNFKETTFGTHRAIVGFNFYF
jgi:hypothetical protein